MRSGAVIYGENHLYIDIQAQICFTEEVRSGSELHIKQIDQTDVLQLPFCILLINLLEQILNRNGMHISRQTSK